MPNMQQVKGTETSNGVLRASVVEPKVFTILPDGTIHWLKTPEDYREAQQIIHEEIGDLVSDQGWAGPVKSAPEPEYVA